MEVQRWIEFAKKEIFAKNLLEKVPINIKCDNVGAIYLPNNNCNSQRAKHIDTPTHFVRKWVEDDILKIIFTPTLDNTTYSRIMLSAVKLVKTMPKGTETCNVTTFQVKITFLNFNKMNGLK
jgi:hypothetical protein